MSYHTGKISILYYVAASHAFAYAEQKIPFKVNVFIIIPITQATTIKLL